jgi:hypothetical protein
MKVYHFTVYYSSSAKEPPNLRHKKLSIKHIISEKFISCVEEDIERLCIEELIEGSSLNMYDGYEHRVKGKLIEFISGELRVIGGITLLNKPIIHGLLSTISIKQIEFGYNAVQAEERLKQIE